jgi:hypothetical protein
MSWARRVLVLSGVQLLLGRVELRLRLRTERSCFLAVGEPRGESLIWR